MMQFHKMPLQDCWLIIPEIFKDHRGVFLECNHRREFVEATGIEIEFVQDNQSVSNPGVFRCLHFQMGEFGQTKQGQVIHRKVHDVMVDLRQGSPTFQKTHEFILNDQNYHQLNNQSTGTESWGIGKDQDMAINWNFREEDVNLSERETKLLVLKDLCK